MRKVSHHLSFVSARCVLLPARSDFNIWLMMCHFILYSVQGFSSLPTFPVTNICEWFPPISSLISSFNYECPMTLWVPPIYECQNKNLNPQTLLAFELNIELRKKNDGRAQRISLFSIPVGGIQLPIQTVYTNTRKINEKLTASGSTTEIVMCLE